MLSHQVSGDPLQLHEFFLALVAFGSTGLMFIRFKISKFFKRDDD